MHGAGWVAGAHAASWMKNADAEVVAVSSRRRDSAERLIVEGGLDATAYDSLEQALADPRVDVVNISGPNHVHAEQGILAANAGKHILMEKPQALTHDENVALRDAVAKAGVKTVVSFVLRWNPLFENLKSMLRQDVIGRVFYLEVDYWHSLGPWYPGWDWITTKESGRSAMLAAGCHAVDALRYFAHDEIVEVAAFGNNLRGAYEFDANVVAILKFRGGAIGKVSAIFDCEMPYAFNIDVIGTEGTLRDNRVFAKKLFPGQTAWATIPTIMPDSGDVEHHPFDAEINHFVDCILNDTESHCNIADAYYTHETCLAIDRSLAEGGRPISIDQTA